MNLIERYLWSTILGSILLTWVSLTLLFGLFDFLAELGDIKPETRYGSLQALLYTVYKLPRTFYINFPYAVLIGSLMGLGNLTANSEITAMRAAGYSISRIVLTTLKLGLLLVLIAFALGEWIAPRSEAFAQSFKVRQLQQQVALSNKGAWLKNNNNLIKIEKIWSDQKLEGIAVYEIDLGNGGISRIMRAGAAQRLPDEKGWLLEQVSEQRLSENGVSLSEYETLTATDLFPDKVLGLATVTPEQLDARELAIFIEHQRENALNSKRLELEYWRHFTTPLSTLVMLILAAPLVFGMQRNANAGQRIFIGILIGISYLLLERMISRAGSVYGLPPLLSTLLPLILFSVLGLILLRRVR